MTKPTPSEALTPAQMAETLAGFPALTRADRREAEFRDVGFLRHLWTNFDEVAPGVYRSNHPDGRRLRKYRDMGIKAVLSLRGSLHRAPQRIEAARCAELGMQFHLLSFSARQPPRRAALRALFHLFDTLPRPFVMHCKSGADRAGLAAALYLLDQDPANITAAKTQLSRRYLHFASSATGILDHVLDLYAKRLQQGLIPVRDWFETEYDREAAAHDFAALRGWEPRL